GLQLIVKGMGGEWQPVATGLVRLNRAFTEAEQGVKSYQQAFADIGIHWEQLKDKTPQERLEAVPRAFSKTHDEGLRAAAATGLFSRAGLGLIPILVKQGDQLGENMRKQGALTGITEDSIEASERWTRNMAQATAVLHRVGNFAIENMHYVV